MYFFFTEKCDFCDSFCGSAQFLKLSFYDVRYLMYQLLNIYCIMAYHHWY